MPQLFIVLSSLMFSISTIMVRLASDSYSGFTIAFFRFSLGILLSVPFILCSKIRFRQVQMRPLVLRGFLGSVSMVLFFLSVKHLGAGRATLLLNLYPAFVFLTGLVYFSEPFSMKSLLSVMLCITGTFFLFNDTLNFSVTGIILGLSAAAVRGLGVHYIKKASAQNHVVLVYLSVCLCGLSTAPLSADEIFRVHDAVYLYLFAGIGLFSFGAQFLLTYGLQFVTATTGSVFAYTTIPITIVLALFVGEKITMPYIMAILLILSGVMIHIIPLTKE